MPKSADTALISALKFVFNSQEPYVNATLKRLAKSAYDRIEKRSQADAIDRAKTSLDSKQGIKPSV